MHSNFQSRKYELHCKQQLFKEILTNIAVKVNISENIDGRVAPAVAAINKDIDDYKKSYNIAEKGIF